MAIAACQYEEPADRGTTPGVFPETGGVSNGLSPKYTVSCRHHQQRPNGQLFDATSYTTIESLSAHFSVLNKQARRLLQHTDVTIGSPSARSKSVYVLDLLQASDRLGDTLPFKHRFRRVQHRFEIVQATIEESSAPELAHRRSHRLDGFITNIFNSPLAFSRLRSADTQLLLLRSTPTYH